MSTYEVIDAICDVVNPLLVLVIVAALWHRLRRRRYGASVALVVALFAGLAAVYGLYGLDAVFGLWPRFGLDYSTHSAFALVMCTLIAVFVGARRAMAGLLLAYLLAMVYQQYHSVADVITTVVAVTALVTPAFAVLYRKLGAEADLSR